MSPDFCWRADFRDATSSACAWRWARKSVQIMRQVLIESAVLALCGGAIGVGIALASAENSSGSCTGGFAENQSGTNRLDRDGFCVRGFSRDGNRFWSFSGVGGIAIGFVGTVACRPWNQRRTRRASIARDICDRRDGDQSGAARRLRITHQQLCGDDAGAARLRPPSRSDRFAWACRPSSIRWKNRRSFFANCFRCLPQFRASSR